MRIPLRVGSQAILARLYPEKGRFPSNLRHLRLKKKEKDKYLGGEKRKKEGNRLDRRRTLIPITLLLLITSFVLSYCQPQGFCFFLCRDSIGKFNPAPPSCRSSLESSRLQILLAVILAAKQYKHVGNCHVCRCISTWSIPAWGGFQLHSLLPICWILSVCHSWWFPKKCAMGADVARGWEDSRAGRTKGRFCFRLGISPQWDLTWSIVIHLYGRIEHEAGSIRV